MTASDRAAAASSDLSRLMALVEQLPALVNDDADLQRRGAACDAEFLLGIGDAVFYIGIAGGKIVCAERGPLLMRPWQFAIRASADDWARFWMPSPAPGWHDLFALTKLGRAVVEGDLKPFMVHLQFLKDVLAAPRKLAGLAP